MELLKEYFFKILINSNIINQNKKLIIKYCDKQKTIIIRVKIIYTQKFYTIII